MARTVPLFLLVTTNIIGSILAQTPVIGGSCKLGTADVQIGGKQTQFFLKCESTAESAEGEGVWVVKSRSASASSSGSSSAAVPSENTQLHQRPPSSKSLNSSPNICEQDKNARENDACSVSATCLQAHNEFSNSYLQCDQTTLRWTRKSCQDGFQFNFEQQTCIKRQTHRQQASGLICTFSSCSNSNPCSSGSCNNGYCCSSNSGSSNAIILTPSSSSNNCAGCNSQPQVITIPSCPGGSYSVGSCANTGSCATGYSCVQGSCCPSYNSQPSIAIAICPGGGSGVGNCVNNQCATGYQCVQNQCCPSTTTTNPFVCPDGTQAAGGCVNGLCGTGYTCRNGLCCAGSAVNSIRCLDGSEAVGACISSCQSNACGGSTPTYYCGTGYTCTTGNICCAVNSCPGGGTAIGQTVNGLCPAGSTANNGICCSNVCSNGQAGTPPVSGICPDGLTLENGVCCAGIASTLGICEVPDQAVGPCPADGVCPPGNACDATGANCCPVSGFDYRNLECQLGPAIDGLCPAGYTYVFIPENTPQGMCINLQCVPGVCDEAVQAGPCQDGGCQTGFTCFTLADICCPTPTRRFNKLVNGRGRGASRPNYGRPLHSYMPAHQNHAAAPQHAGTQLLSPLPLCSDGTPSVGSCINGLCGVGLICDNNQCCRPGNGKDIRSMCPDGSNAVSSCFANGACGSGLYCLTSKNLCCKGKAPTEFNRPMPLATVRPIGSRCMLDGECVGHADGLSLCHAGVCQCSPIAYTQGIACVRRKHLNLKMADDPVPNTNANVNKAILKQ